MNLNDLLRGKGIDPQDVLVLRHCPTEPELNRVFSRIASERPDVFNAYQQTQGLRVERALKDAKYVASFIGQQPGRALFVGLYSVKGSKAITRQQFWEVPAYVYLKEFGMKGFSEDEMRQHILWFDMELTDFYSHWKGKLVVAWPGKEISWYRWAYKPKNEMAVLAILPDSALVSAMPKWNELSLAWGELSLLPAAWQVTLGAWRGVYFIFDKCDGKGYVGAAYGEQNLFGRWRNYAARGHGGNRLLRERDPKNFQFTILELVSPNMPADDVIRLEANWKDRLHTRHPFGLNDN